MRKLIGFVATVAIIVLVGCALKPLTLTTFPVEPRFTLMVSTEADRQIEQLAQLTRLTRKEQASCVTLYSIKHTGGENFVFVILKLGPSNPYDSDSLRVWTLNKQPFCADSFPNLHTHIVKNEAWGRPSEWDQMHDKDWSTAPFKVLLSVSDESRKPSKLSLYGIR